jgi:hypothetical protein
MPVCVWPSVQPIGYAMNMGARALSQCRCVWLFVQRRGFIELIWSYLEGICLPSEVMDARRRVTEHLPEGIHGRERA